MLRRTAVVLAACSFAAACGSDPALTAGTGSDPAPSVTTSPVPALSPQPARSPASQEATAFGADTSPDVQTASGGPMTVTAVRVARQDGYDRVVFELAGRAGGEPGWRVAYEDDPRRDGSGDPVDVEGDATLVVRIDGTGYPTDTGEEEVSGAPRVPADAVVVEDLELGAVFEGTYEAFVGVAREAPFRVFRLTDPARVVVDVRHD